MVLPDGVEMKGLCDNWLAGYGICATGWFTVLDIFSGILMYVRFRQLALMPSSGEWPAVYLQKNTLREKCISNGYSGDFSLSVGKSWCRPRTYAITISYATIRCFALTVLGAKSVPSLVVTATERFVIWITSLISAIPSMSFLLFFIFLENTGMRS